MCNSSQTEILRQVEFDTCLKLFSLHAESEDEIFSEIRPNRDTQKHPSFYTWQLENKLLKACVLWMNDNRIHRKMKISRDDSAVKLGCRDFHATNRKRYQSKLLLVHSKGDQCNFWGFLHRNDQRTPWWVDELASVDLSMIVVAQPPSWFVRLLTVMPFIIYVFLCFTFGHENIWRSAC